MLKKFGLVPTSSKAVGVGDVYGRLKVLAVGQIQNTYRYFSVCKCDCGNIISVRSDALKKPVPTNSCGCLQREAIKTHGLTKSAHYDRWFHMMTRCYKPESKSYKNYGGRGITVCERWHDVANFVADLPDGYFQGAEIDRINNDGNYEPSNVRWASKSENCDNRSTGRKLTFRGEAKSVTQWGKEFGVARSVISERIDVWGWSVSKAITTPALDKNERMLIARKNRWEGHQKPVKPPKFIRQTFIYQGKMLDTSDLAEVTGIPRRILSKRLIDEGWTVEKAISQPIRQRSKT